MRTAMAMLVSAAVGTSVTVPGSSRSTVSMITSTAWRGSSVRVGKGSTGPSRPVLPWMVCAVDSSPTSGRGQPAAIGTSRTPPMVATTSALRVTFSNVELPITVVMASSSISGLPWASRRAMASSWPGSQSRMIFLGTPTTLAASARPGRALP